MLDTSSPILTASLYPEAKKQFALKRLRTAIIDCELLPGATFSEAEIASRFNLGRAAVRSALAQLEMSGLIVAQARNGWHVPVITGAAVGDLIAARLALEPQLVQVRMPPEVVAELSALAAQLGALSGSRSVEAVVTARNIDRTLMQLLAAQSGALVAAWVADVADRSARLLAYFEKDRPQFVALGRDELVAQLVDGNVTRAGDSLRDEVVRYREYIINKMLSSDAIASVATEKRGLALSKAQDTHQALKTNSTHSSSASKGHKL